jgi:hypothetical protein
MVVRKGKDAVDTAGLESDKDYWQPITMMVEVAYGREEILNCIRRWVKPAEDSRKHMEEVMQRCERAPETHLALRLPLKSTMLPESEAASKEATPVVDEKTKAKSTVKYIKKSAPKAAAATPELAKQKSAETSTIGTPVADDKVASEPGPRTESTAPPAAAPSEQKEAPPADANAAANNDSTTTADDNRPRRATRKSGRISEV